VALIGYQQALIGQLENKLLPYALGIMLRDSLGDIWRITYPFILFTN